MVMGFTVAATALKDNQKWSRNAFICLFPECQLKACVCGWHVGACWSTLGERALAEVGLRVCLWLPGCRCLPWDSDLACHNKPVPSLSSLWSSSFACQCRKNQQSFSKPAHKHTWHPGGPAEESRTRSGKQRVQGILGKIWGMFWGCQHCWQALMFPLSLPLLF